MYADASAFLKQLPPESKRGALSLIGLCVGDIVGLPFELSQHRQNRLEADHASSQGSEALAKLVLELVVNRLGRGGPGNPFTRSYSDDTVCTDLKMAALAQCFELSKREGFRDEDLGSLLWKCFLSQLLAWSWGQAQGQLFQGYGGFTKGLLRPEWQGAIPSLDIQQGLPGCDTWPEDWFVKHAHAHCSGGTGFSSFGNGAVMCFAPQALAASVGKGAWPILETDAWQRAQWNLAKTHQNPEALCGARLLNELLIAIWAGQVADCSSLRQAVRESRTWKEILSSDLRQSTTYPVEAFNEFLEGGDADPGGVARFLVEITGVPSPVLTPHIAAGYDVGEGGGHHLGQLLRTAANWEDDQRQDREPKYIRFSQRGLNTVLIAIWCCSNARSMMDWISRLIYIGGDSDTIGAVCGQLAAPLLPEEDVLETFSRYALLETCHSLRPSAEVACAAARRYLRRVLLFVSGKWSLLAQAPRLVDPAYPGLTSDCGRAITCPGTAVRVLWVDRAFHPSSKVPLEVARRSEAEQAERNGRIQFMLQTSNIDDAMAMLQWARTGAVAIDAVVSELRIGREDQGGLLLLQHLRSLWEGQEYSRPLFVLLMPYKSREIANSVLSQRGTKLARADTPKDVLKAIVEGWCVAAVTQPLASL